MAQSDVDNGGDEEDAADNNSGPSVNTGRKRQRAPVENGSTVGQNLR